MPVTAVKAVIDRSGRVLVIRGIQGELGWWEISEPDRPQKIAQSSARAGSAPGPLAVNHDSTLTLATEVGAPGTLIDTSDPTAPFTLSTQPGLDDTATDGDAALDGTLLVVSTLGLLRVWDVTEPAEAALLTEFGAGDTTGVVNGRAAISPTGVLAASQLGPVPDAYRSGLATARLWDLSQVKKIVDDPAGVACRRAGGELDAEQWHRYAPELKPRRLCG